MLTSSGLRKNAVKKLFHNILGPFWEVDVGKEMCISTRNPGWVLEILKSLGNMAPFFFILTSWKGGFELLERVLAWLVTDYSSKFWSTISLHQAQ